MHYLAATLPTVAENLALDEALLLEAEAGRSGELLRLWEWPAHTVVLGAASRRAEDVNEEACRADGVPVQRRASGGGSVLLGHGCLCFSLVLGYDRDPALAEIRSSYVYILERLATALQSLLPGIAPAGTSDLAAAGRKFSGNAQQRKRRFLLHHGTLLYDFDPGAVQRYLAAPARQPEYRRGRPHAEFLTNLPAAAPELARRLQECWHAEQGPCFVPTERVAALVRDKYATAAWVQRR